MASALPTLREISTHSRAKAAGKLIYAAATVKANFNSQPREGGWARLAFGTGLAVISTHSRAKAAGGGHYADRPDYISTHSRAKAAGQT